MDSYTRIFFVMVAVVVAASLLLRDRGAPDTPAPAPSVFAPSDELAVEPAPGRPGPYEVCPREYEETLPSGGAVVGIIYAPVLDARTCTTVARKFNLAIIAHADGSGVNHLDYDALGRHLASNALIAVSVRRYPPGQAGDAWTVFDDVLTDTLDYLYNRSGVRDFLGDRIGLIGHSAGGRSVIYNAGAVGTFGKDLRAVIAMSPTVSMPAVTLNGVTPAFLGIQVAADKLDDFENGDAGVNARGGQNVPGGAPFDLVEEAAFRLDEFSPHSTAVLHVGVGPPPQTASSMQFRFRQPTDVAALRYLGLRATQVYHPDTNPSGVSQDISVTLETAGGSDTVRLSEAGGTLRFHPVVPLPSIPFAVPLPVGAAPEVTEANGATKNAMRSYLISLRDFEDVDLGAVTAVRLSFEDVTQSTRFLLDDLAFYGF